MEYTLLVYAEARRIRTAEMIAEDLSAIGVKITVKPMDPDTVDSLVWPEFDVRSGRNYDLALWSWSAPVQLNPAAPLALLSSVPEIGNLNIGGFTNDLIDDYCRQYELTASSSEREIIAERIWREASEQAPFIVLYYDDVLSAVNTNKFDYWKMRKGVGIINKFTFLPLPCRN